MNKWSKGSLCVFGSWSWTLWLDGGQAEARGAWSQCSYLEGHRAQSERQTRSSWWKIKRESKWQLWLVNMAILPLFTQLCTICEIIWQHEARQTQSINKLSGHFIKYLIQLQVCPFVTESGVRPSTWWKAQRESAVTLFVCDRHGISVLLTSWVRRN